MSTAAFGQYDPSHKYNFFSNIEIGGAAQYSRDLTCGRGNLGADLRLTKRLGTHCRLRGIADVDGFLRNGYDRKGSAFVGISADFLPFYAFVDGGISYNPSSVQRINPAAEAGVGLHFNIGRNLLAGSSDDWRIEGFASPDGDPYRNQQLSLLRAQSVKDFLVDLHVSEARLIAYGNGIGSTYDAASPLNRMVRITKISK